MAKTISGPFRLQIKASGGPAQTFGSIDDLAFEGRILTTFIDPQTRLSGSPFCGKHTNAVFCPANGKIYVHGGDGGYPGAGDSGCIHSVRYTLNAASTNVTIDLYYPYWGVAGQKFPAGAGANPFVWDSFRECFWTGGGFYEGLGWMPTSPHLVPGALLPAGGQYRGLFRFWVTGPQAGTWEEVNANIPILPNEGMGDMIYHPPSDCLLWLAPMNAGSSSPMGWYHCTSGNYGTVTIGVDPSNSPYSGPFPGVQPGRFAGTGEVAVWDSVKNELIWNQVFDAAPEFKGTGFAGIYATSLAGFTAASPTNRTTRQLWRGYQGGGNQSGAHQRPLFIRNRRLYTTTYPWQSQLDDNDQNPQNQGSGLGIYELELDAVPPVMRQAAAPSALAAPGYPAPVKIAGINGGAYDPVNDAILAFHRGGSGTQATAGVILKWRPPSWTPAAGNVKAITLDSAGQPTNTIASVFYPKQPNLGGGAGSVVAAWASGCYARTLSTNGCLLLCNGGDADYWGNEIYSFDFDTRRWSRLTDPILTMTGDKVKDITWPTNDPRYFNTAECEHGPAVGDYGWGLLPTVGGVQPTQPGVPHTYDGMEWIPGSFIGNMRGALVRPISQFVYTTRSTGRAHYFDLDPWVMKWGRLSTNKASSFDSTTTNSAFDEKSGRIYHQGGYLDLNTKQHINSLGFGGFHCSMCFDPVRNLLIRTNSDDDGLTARNLNTGAIFSLNLTGDPRWQLFAGNPGWFAGLLHCPALDCLFIYSQGSSASSTQQQAQTIWKVSPASTNPSTAWSVQKITMPGDKVGFDPNVRGTFGRFQWIPPLKCIAFFHLVNGPVYLYKPEGL